jgi:thioredoxin-like negative regulator of GroEL
MRRLDLARLVPWALPKPEDLARGADLLAEGPRTAALVPHGAGRKGKDGKPLPYVQALFLFDGEGRLAERRLVGMPGKKVLLRETCSAEGVVKVLDADAKEVATRKGKLAEGKAPDLKPDTRKLVVLDLPFRSPEHVQKALKVEKKNDTELTFAEARALLAAFVAAGNGPRAQQLFQQALAARDQHQLGYYVLLASAGVNLDSEHADVLAQHPHDPLAHYLALHSSPVLRKHASQWAAGSSVWGEGFLKRLALAHALCQRWQSGKALGGTPAQRRAERDRALEFVRKHKASPFAWALLGLVQDRTDESAARQEDVRADYRSLAEHWKLFEGVPALSSAARYEQARCLSRAGRKDEARKRFVELYEQTFKEGALLRLDSDFRAALLGGGKEEDGWNALMRRTAARLVKEGKRPAVLALARQCWQVDDQPLAQQLFRLAMADLPGGKERLPLQLAGVEFLWQTGQLASADRLLRQMLDEPANAKRPALWRLAAQLAGQRDLPARQLECLEKALDAEYRDLPAVINLQQVRTDYGGLLDHYQSLAQALVTLKVDPPAGFADKVVRAADRWRSLDREATKACQTAARILQVLGRRELAWDYLTTPVALRPHESEAWSGLAEQLKRQGEPLLADRAFRAAFEAEPTNAQLLWDRAENLRQSGRLTQARALYRQLAEGEWQPRFSGLVTQARWALEGR